MVKAETKKTKKEEKAPKVKAAPAKKAVATTEAAATTPARPMVVQGIVVSDKMQKTIVVRIDRRVRHAEYGKIITRSNKYKAHDEKSEAKTGDRVEIVQTRPISKDKRWALRKIVERAALQQSEELAV